MLRLGLEVSTWAPGTIAIMMIAAIKVIATTEEDGVGNCGKRASTRKS
jgi:hypothetical protein